MGSFVIEANLRLHWKIHNALLELDRTLQTDWPTCLPQRYETFCLSCCFFLNFLGSLKTLSSFATILFSSDKVPLPLMILNSASSISKKSVYSKKSVSNSFYKKFILLHFIENNFIQMYAGHRLVKMKVNTLFGEVISASGKVSSVFYSLGTMWQERAVYSVK